MLWAGRKEPRFADFRERLRSDHLNGIYKSPTEEETKVDRRLINAASAVLAEVGVKLDAGKSRMVLCLFSLFGITVEPEKRTSKRRGAASTLILNRESVAKLLELASQYAPPTLKSLIVPLDTKSPNPLLTHAVYQLRHEPLFPLREPRSRRLGNGLGHP